MKLFDWALYFCTYSTEGDHVLVKETTLLESARDDKDEEKP